MLLYVGDRTGRETAWGVIQIYITLVGDHVNAALVGQTKNGGEVCRIEHGPARVVGTINDDGAGAGRDLPLDHLRGETEIVWLRRLHKDALASGVFDDV